VWKKHGLRRGQGKPALKYPIGLISMLALVCKLEEGEIIFANQEMECRYV
jgi:hypothetical protein